MGASKKEENVFLPLYEKKNNYDRRSFMKRRLSFTYLNMFSSLERLFYEKRSDEMCVLRTSLMLVCGMMRAMECQIN